MGKGYIVFLFIGFLRGGAREERPPTLHTIHEILYGGVQPEETFPSAFEVVNGTIGLSTLRRKSQMFTDTPYGNTYV